MSSTRRPRILVIDDIPGFLDEIKEILAPGFRVTTCQSPLEAIGKASRESFDLVITTLVMKELDGFDVIRRLRGAGVAIPIILVTGYGGSNTAVEALRLGASDYLAKPVEPEELRVRVRRALEREAATHSVFLTKDPAALALLQLVKQVAASEARVLIGGETGTGKELIAQILHQRSLRKGEPFVAINCAAIPADLIESELFGHEQGAFTGAAKRRIGKFEEAGKGTLFLDEIGELGIAMQSKLLRVLQGGDFQRVGGSSTLGLKARIVTATNRDLRFEVHEGRFREDLFFRLNVVNLRIPSLRERRADIRLLGAHFIRRFAPSPKLAIGISEAAWKVMESYDWPGNVRELEHLVERLSVLYAGQEIGAGHIPELAEPRPELRSAALAPYSEALAGFQKTYFQRALAAAGNNLSQASRMAGMDKGQFHRTIVRLGLHQSRDR